MANTSTPKLKMGIFEAELKNRFRCSVCVDGETITCYIPSSCRLSNFIDLRGRTVLLKPNTTSQSRTAYTVYAVKCGRKFIPVTLVQVNSVMAEALNKRRFSFLGKRQEIIREHRIGNYKSDLYIVDTKTLIEIKSILSLEKEALFPSIYSERAINQLKEIRSLLDAGYCACYVLVSLNSGVEKVAINRSIADYYKLFQECVNKGMVCYAASIKLDAEMRPQLYKRIGFSVPSQESKI